ncbi:MAG: SagB/ThcOx family dehydrogenase [Rhodococcus sp. (in: high G+C Gram-positive bacteria)]
MTTFLTALTDGPIRFRSDTSVTTTDGRTVIGGPLVHIAVRGLRPEVLATLERMTDWIDLDDERLALGDNGRSQLDRVLDRVADLLMTRVDGIDRTPLIAVSSTRRGATYTPADLASDDRIRLSRFTLMRIRDSQMVIESPLATHRLTILNPAVSALVTLLSSGPQVSDVIDQCPIASTRVLAHLVGTGLVEVARAEEPGFRSDIDTTLRQWDFHDLLMHSRSRSGAFDEAFGGTFPYVGQIDPQPALKIPPEGEAIALAVPVWDEIAGRDPSLAAVMEARTSVREYGDAPMHVDQLAEFLYRTARVRATCEPSPHAPYEGSTRPYPCGGAAYELELYLTIARCDGIAPGMYYYDPARHRLILVNSSEADRDTMIRVASVATAHQANPDILVTMTSRFQRLSWKYRAIAYSVTLRHAGVLYQTMYLVATAMGLAPCGLGSGDSELSARVFGLDHLRESSVGDFILGSRPTTPPAPAQRPEGWAPRNDLGWHHRARRAIAEVQASKS